jgi:hypothetical protein
VEARAVVNGEPVVGVGEAWDSDTFLLQFPVEVRHIIAEAKATANAVQEVGFLVGARSIGLPV